MRTAVPWCHANSCLHITDLLEGVLACRAFPHGIPGEIFRGEFEHTEPYPGDSGIRFEREDGKPPLVHFSDRD